jgi:thiosulfate/3-mercaptopyruvate sulfurtransferase
VDIVTVEWLRERIGDPDLRVADVRWYLTDPGGGRRAYDAGHLPGAIFVDVSTVLAAPVGEGPGRHPLPEPRAFADALGAIGIGTGHTVVAYDDVGAANAARLWWMLDVLGHPRVAVLDGGIAAWVEAGGALKTDEPDHAPASLELGDRWQRVVDTDDVRRGLDSIVLLDARAVERYRGETEPVDPVAGHIPSARSLPATGLVDAGGRLLAADELRQRFAAAGAGESADGPVVVSCGSGVTACQLALARRVAGLPDPLLYEGSYSDWSRSGLPIATGSDPG